MFNLKWEHIDWARGFINLVGKDDGLGAKSGHSERIPLNEMALAFELQFPKALASMCFQEREEEAR